LIDRRYRHNLKVAHRALGYDEGREQKPSAMHFELVDLKLSVAVRSPMRRKFSRVTSRA